MSKQGSELLALLPSGWRKRYEVTARGRSSGGGPGHGSHRFVGYRIGVACSAYPTCVGGPGCSLRLVPVYSGPRSAVRPSRTDGATPRAPPGSKAGSPRPGPATPAGSWSMQPGTTSPGTPSGRPCASGGTWHPPRGARRRGKQTPAPAVGPVQRTRQTRRHRQRRRRPRAGRLVLVPGRHGPTPTTARLPGPADGSAWSDPRDSYEATGLTS